MRILDRNWRCQVDGLRGEMDLVALDGATLVFCEVKTRKRPTPAGPLEGITPEKLRRLRRLAGAWMAETERLGTGQHRGRELRIDAVGIHWPEGGGAPVITHLEGIDR